MKKCKVEKCNNQSHSKGYCPKHYGRFKKHGDAEAIHRLQHLSPDERFWMKVQKGSSDECWNWKESNRKGYGCLWVNRKYVSAHRFSWLIHHGLIENGLEVLHKCDNTLCVNPAHLFLGTTLDNTKDRVLKGRSAKGSKTNSRGTLCEKDVLIIKNLLQNTKQSIVAHHLNIKPSTISRIARGVTYAYYN